MRHAPKNMRHVDPTGYGEGHPFGIGFDGRPKPPSAKDDWCPNQGGRLQPLNLSKRKLVRCIVCKRRVLPAAIWCVGGEFIKWVIPQHKWPKAKKPKPKRKERKARLARR